MNGAFGNDSMTVDIHFDGYDPKPYVHTMLHMYDLDGDQYSVEINHGEDWFQVTSGEFKWLDLPLEDLSTIIEVNRATRHWDDTPPRTKKDVRQALRHLKLPLTITIERDKVEKAA